ncbi:MAG: flagellar basal body rod protein FlgB [Sterolibacterium sp.]
MAAPSGNAGQSFSTALAQAISQPSGSSSVVNAASHSGGHNVGASIPNGGSHPQHFPIGASNHGGEHGFQETALGLRAYRQQLIASNIANADTPGYKAVDIDFQEALRIARSITNTPPLTLSTTASSHITGQSQSAAPTYPLKYHTPSQTSVDGNTVEMDVERAKFAENAVMYEFSLSRVSGHFKMLMEMLQNLKD